MPQSHSPFQDLGPLHLDDIVQWTRAHEHLPERVRRHQRQQDQLEQEERQALEAANAEREEQRLQQVREEEREAARRRHQELDAIRQQEIQELQQRLRQQEVAQRQQQVIISGLRTRVDALATQPAAGATAADSLPPLPPLIPGTVVTHPGPLTSTPRRAERTTHQVLDVNPLTPHTNTANVSTNQLPDYVNSILARLTELSSSPGLNSSERQPATTSLFASPALNGAHQTPTARQDAPRPQTRLQRRSTSSGPSMGTPFGAHHQGHYHSDPEH